MRVPPPSSLKLSASELLRDVRDRLADKHPEFEASLDATHPAWLVLRETAWMVEAMSEQLDHYPWAVLQQFAHLVGVQLRPAQPSIGFTVLEASEDGRLDLTEDPGRWRFFAPRTETRGLVEFALAETDVRVTAGHIRSLCQVVHGELHRLDTSTSAASASFGAPILSKVFEEETFTWTVLATAVERVDALLREAAERLLSEREIGWLRFEVTVAQDHVILVATIDPTGAFRACPKVTPGGDVVGAWGTLDDSTWTPDVRVANHPLLPHVLRRSRPLAGEDPSQILIPDVPPGLNTVELLQRDARPAPQELFDSIWSTLVHLETRLGPLRPTAVRGVVTPDSEPSWVDSALRNQAWRSIVDRGDLSIARVDFNTVVLRERTVRVGWIGAGERCRAFAMVEHGTDPVELPSRVVWTDRFPDADGALQTVVCVELTVPEQASGLLLATDGRAHSVLLNPVLLVNAPIVRDGRRVTVQRAIPEPVHLLYKDVLTPEVMERLGRGGLDSSTCSILESMALGKLSWATGTIVDFAGASTDPCDGVVVLNAPDREGVVRSIGRGESVRLDWYRRTDASLANLPPHSIRLVEQPPTVSPRILSVDHPLGFLHGNDRETQESAVQRAFGPTGSVPVTPGDWERLVRQALGARGRGWLVRVWGYSERSMMSTAVWPPASVGPEPESFMLTEALRNAGPETLLVALGPTSQLLSPSDLGWARVVVVGLINEWNDRVPAIEDVVVTPLWPLRLVGGEPMATPAYALRGLVGTLVDTTGRRGPPPKATLLLNAAVVEVVDGP